MHVEEEAETVSALNPSRVRVLYAVTGLLLLVSLGWRPLWGQEGRWAVICREMMASADYTHPVLMGAAYEDKPLLSYWLMVGAARLTGGLSEWALRLPSALAGWVAVWCVVRVGRRLFGEPTAVLAGWILVTTFFFIFWARVSSADMLNVAAILAALSWYVERRERPGFVSFAGFTSLLALGGLMKGLVAPAVAVVAILPDLWTRGRAKSFLRVSLLPALAIGAAVYLLPFALAGTGGASNGLWMAFRESVVRYFRPFDHSDHGWLYYFAQLPLLLLPWTLFLPGVLVRAFQQGSRLSQASRWPLVSSALVFLFLEGSGSRRDYYLLPILPLLALSIADGIAGDDAANPLRGRISRAVASSSAALMLIWFGGLQPYLATIGGARVFRREVQEAAESVGPWSSWVLLSCSAPPDADYYLSPSGRTGESLRVEETEAVRSFLREHPRTIVVTYGRNRKALEPLLGSCLVVEMRPMMPSWLHRFAPGVPSEIAFIPSSPR